MTVRELLMESRKRLVDSGVDSPELSARLLVCSVLGLDEVRLIVDGTRSVEPADAERIRDLVARRTAGEPVAYILGSKEFYSLDFTVTPDTLIPRPETELIIDLAQERFRSDLPIVFADWGTGSGILAAVLLFMFPAGRGIAVDLSPGALRVARANILSHVRDHRFFTVLGDFTRPLITSGSLDLLVCNPPYVTRFEYEEADHEVTRFEPVEALVSGEEGMDHIRALAPHARKALKPGGVLLMEIGCGQAGLVREALTESSSPFEHVAVHRDGAGLDRVVEAW